MGSLPAEEAVTEPLRPQAPNNMVERTGPERPATQHARSVLHLFVRWKRSPLAGVLRVALTRLWKGGFHESPTRSTVQPAEVSGGVTLAGTAGLLGLHSRPVTAEPPPETTRLRLVRGPAICVAPKYVAEELLPGEGFTEVQYVKKESIVAKQMALAASDADEERRFEVIGDVALIEYLQRKYVGAEETHGDRVDVRSDRAKVQSFAIWNGNGLVEEEHPAEKQDRGAHGRFPLIFHPPYVLNCL